MDYHMNSVSNGWLGTLSLGSFPTLPIFPLGVSSLKAMGTQTVVHLWHIPSHHTAREWLWVQIQTLPFKSPLYVVSLSFLIYKMGRHLVPPLLISLNINTCSRSCPGKMC